MQFLVDAQLPPALATWLIGQGHTALHVFDLGLGRANDRTIWDRAVKDGAVIVTKDEDFAVRKALENVGPKVVWVRFGNTTRPAAPPHHQEGKSDRQHKETLVYRARVEIRSVPRESSGPDSHPASPVGHRESSCSAAH